LRPLISLSRRFRTRTPAGAPLIASSQPQPLLRTEFEFPLQLITRVLPMNEIAESATHTSLSAVKATARFAEIRNRGELAVDWACCIPARVEGVAGFLRAVFVFEACVDVAD
jgi:hypothetical protein